jgi:hypothetical protein
MLAYTYDIQKQLSRPPWGLHSWILEESEWCAAAAPAMVLTKPRLFHAPKAAAGAAADDDVALTTAAGLGAPAPAGTVSGGPGGSLSDGSGMVTPAEGPPEREQLLSAGGPEAPVKPWRCTLTKPG